MSFVESVGAQRLRRENNTEVVRRIAKNKIAAVAVQTQGQTEIQVLLALGAACPFGYQWERNIWSEEVHERFYA